MVNLKVDELVDAIKHIFLYLDKTYFLSMVSSKKVGASMSLL